MNLRAPHIAVVAVPLVIVAAMSACSSSAPTERAQTSGSAIVACVDPGAPIAPGSWVCGSDRTVECTSPNGADAGALLVVPIVLDDSGTPPDCNAVTLTPSESLVGPQAIGDHVITVREDTGSSSGVACTSTLHVVDTVPPVATSHDVMLWPPNHEMHDVSVADCVSATDVCDAAPKIAFTYVTSDEPVGVKGSGHTSPDIEVVDCDHLRVRSERAGGSDGRVYRIGFEIVDHANNRTTGSCRVIVPHDQSGRAAVEGAEAYRVVVDTSHCL